MIVIRIENRLWRLLLWGFVLAGLHGVTTLTLFHLSGRRYDPTGTISRFVGVAAADIQHVLHALLFVLGLDGARPLHLRFALFATESLAYGYGAAAIATFVFEQFKNRQAE